MARLRDIYKSKVMPELRQKFEYTTVMAIPKIEKIVLSMGVGRALQDKKYLDEARKELSAISGQRPLICKAKQSVSNFKLREGQDIGLKVTLRGERMYEFMDRLINLSIPQVKDFRGLNPKSFDGKGNYSMGLSEQSVFPEIDPARIQFTQGMNITFVTTAKNREESLEMLKLFGMPFREA
jgi:large subunit ribosomal protein L5